MNDSRPEYFNGNGNGNGSAHSKIFDMAPKEDPLLKHIVPAARRKMCLNTRVCESARMFFCYLTDASLLPGVNSRKGVVKFSDHDLSVRFKVNVKTIRNWKRAIESTGEVWLTEKWMKNSFPQTVYNITAIVGQALLPQNSDSEDGSLAEDEIFSSNRRRQKAVSHHPICGKFVDRFGNYKPKGTPPGVTDTAALTAGPQKTEENPPSVKILPSTTAMDCRPPRQMVAVHHGNGLPSPSATDCRPARQMVAAHDGKILPSSTANGCRREGKTDADNGKTRDVSQRCPEIPFKRSTGLNARNGSGGAKKTSAEEGFLSEVWEMMERWKPGSSKPEHVNNGVWWRNAFRKNPRLARTVQADALSAVKEGRIKFNPPSFAIDLWTRLGGGKVTNEALKQKAAVAPAART